MDAATRQKWVDWSQILSAVLVVVSLVYVAIEVRQSVKLGSADVETEIYDRLYDMGRMIVESDGLAGIVLRAREDIGQLTPEERFRYAQYQLLFFDTWEFAAVQYDDGVLGAEDWVSWECWFIREARRRPPEAFEDNLRSYFDDFIKYVRENVAWGEESHPKLEGCSTVLKTTSVE